MFTLYAHCVRAQAYVGNSSEHLFTSAEYAANREHIQVRTDDKQRTVASSQALLLGLFDFDSKYCSLLLLLSLVFALLLFSLLLLVVLQLIALPGCAVLYQLTLSVLCDGTMLSYASI
jgi:hypothetical protein